MTGYTLDEAADRAGVPPELLRELVDAGVIARSDAYDDGTVRRAMLLGACVGAGLTVDALGRATASGHLDLRVVDACHDGCWGQPTDATWAETAAGYGGVVERDGDVFGRTVNLAARISGVAGADEALVTRETVEAVDDERLAFTHYGDVPLKGVAVPVELYRAGAS